MNIDIKDAQNVYNLIDNTFNKQENKSSGIKQIDINTVPDRSLHQLPYETAEKLFNLSLNQRLQYFEEIKEKCQMIYIGPYFEHCGLMMESAANNGKS